MAPVTNKLGLSCFRNRSREIPSPTKHLHTKRASVGGPPMLSASSSNNHSLFSFGRNGPDTVSSPEAVDQEPSSSNQQYGFLPEVSFDDFQTSIESASDDLQLTQFPSPTGEGSILASQGFGESKMVERPSTLRNGATARAPVQQSQHQEQPQQPVRTRTAPVFRRPSVSNRQASISSTASTMSRTSDANRDQATIRPKRQNQHPPISNSGFVGKQHQPRKSIGVPDSADNGNGTGARRRPVLAANADRIGVDSSRASIDGEAHYPDTSRNMTASRAAKIKTLSQPPPPRISASNPSADNTLLGVDQDTASASGPRSPRAGGKSGATTPGSTRRMSILPGHSSHHVSGLGARTVSPTDAQRLKRRSFMPDAQNNESLNSLMILQPPPPPTDRPSSRSPSMLPRKASTPVSQRTTPDPNRKSYSSGFSVGSIASSNTVRTSTGSLQARAQPNAGSRLPAPKSTNNLPSPNDDEEDVPPVPAIPKVYESPKDSPAELSFLDKRKSNLGLDSSSLRSDSTGSLSGPAMQEKPKVQRKGSTRKVAHNPSMQMDPEKKPQPERTQPVQPRRNFKSMNLPPLTVGPLSTPTVNKIAKLQLDQNQTDRKISSPPARQITKTPTTPMTASRSTFFTRRKELAHHRSTSSVHQARPVDSPLLADTSSSESVAGSITKPSVSPYLSSSVPKEGGFEQHYMKRSQTGSEMRDTDDATSNSVAQSKPSGPRAQRQPSRTVSKASVKPISKSPVPVQQSSPEDPQTPSSMSSLRRKLSLSWKRSSSKTEKHPENNAATKHDAMPPPRLPVSATTGNSVSVKASNSSLSSKASALQLDANRRKTSGTGLNGLSSTMHHARNRSDAGLGTQATATASRPARIDSAEASSNRSTASSSSVMQKFLRTKASAAKIQQQQQNETFTADLDKDDLIAEEEMKKLGSRRKETELAAKTLDTLRKRATPKERVSPQDAIRIAMLNIYERGEIIDYKDIYFCGTQNAQKVVGDLNSKSPNFGYDDDRGDYTIVIGDHLSYRYEIVDVLGKGSFGQVVRCIDHKTGVLVAVKIIRNKKRFHQQALVEVNILQKLREWASLTGIVFRVRR